MTGFTMFFEHRKNSLLLRVKVVPNSRRTQFAGILGDALKIKIAEPPEKGRANRAVEKLLAQALGVPASHIAIIAGHSAPLKTIQITGLTEEAVTQKLGAIFANSALSKSAKSE